MHIYVYIHIYIFIYIYIHSLNRFHFVCRYRSIIVALKGHSKYLNLVGTARCGAGRKVKFTRFRTNQINIYPYEIIFRSFNRLAHTDDTTYRTHVTIDVR